MSAGRLAPVSAAWVVILAGISAALHVGKLPPAIDALQAALGITLVQAGFLLSLVQLAGMALGMAAGLLADGLGLRRSMLAGLWLLGAAGLAGGWAQGVGSLMALRVAEGVGVLLVTVPAPGLLRRHVAPGQLTRMLGFWGAYMPLGTALGLLLGPLVLGAWPWPVWWWLTAALSLGMALWVWQALPPDARPAALPVAAAGAAPAAAPPWAQRLRDTWRAPGPWLGALCFGAYSAQWLAVVGFLPALYQQAGWGGGLSGLLTACVAAANLLGNVAAGRGLQRGVAPQRLLWTGYGAMALGAWLAFGLLDAAPAWRYAGALLFSSLGGLVPGTLFGVAPRLAPSVHSLATTVGWMQQLSATGQLLGPPLVAWAASRVGHWELTWAITGGFCLLGAGLAAVLGWQQARRRPDAGMA